MRQQEDKSLEDYVERFLYNFQKYKHKFNHNTIRTIFFMNGIQDENIDILNLMRLGDISQLSFEAICKLCRKYSQSKAKTGKEIRDTRINKSDSIHVTRVELRNLLESFETNILGTLSLQLDTNRRKKKQDEEEAILAIYFSKCRKRLPLREFPLNSVNICGRCIANHKTENHPSFPKLQAIFKGGNGEVETSFSIYTKKTMETKNT